MSLMNWIEEHVFGFGDWCVVDDGEEIYAIPISRKIAADTLLDWGMSAKRAREDARRRSADRTAQEQAQ